MRLQTILAFLLVTPVCLRATRAEQPERTVEHNIVTSLRDPKVQIRLPASATYCGADRWVLFDIADCELHAFIEPDPDKNVHRLYWIQFEQYLASKPDLHHQYDSPRHARIGGEDFYVDTEIGSFDNKPKFGSDGEHIRAMIAARGYKWPRDFMYVRFVHLLDKAKRKELMIIYAEDLSATGFSAADLREGGRVHNAWSNLEEELIERARQAIEVTF
ncbi:MAG: hypothetical protein ACJ8M1_14220 [Chthoniobacterales bacterium]